METKNVLYAAVGAPVVAGRKVSEKVQSLRTKLSEGATDYTKAAGKTIDTWAVEGEKVVGRISEGKVVDEITSKVDLDQAKEQVSKLRDQLEDMLATWRSSFRPEKVGEKVEVETKAPARKPAARKPAAKKTTTKASAAKTAKSTAAKTSTEKPASAPAEKAS
ncbi:MAG TPA: hypothetical protein VIC07_01360 [Acidimicrobiia bacterium]|jgi:hypothetical protein